MESGPISGDNRDEVHPPGKERLWSESWYFDFASVDGSAGGFVRVGDYPNIGRRWLWAYVTAGSDAAGCAIDHPLSGRRQAPWQAADPSLWLRVESADDGWYITAAGDGFGMDLTWREQAPEYTYQRGSRTEQPGWAVGEVSLGGTAYLVDGPGQRDHSWGVRDWWRFGWDWCAGWLSDGMRFQATQLDARGRIAPDGYLMVPGAPVQPLETAAVHAATIQVNGTVLDFTEVAVVTLDLPSPTEETSQLRRAMIRLRAGAAQGVGWREHNRPGPAPPARD